MKLTCPSCSKTLNVDDRSMGKLVRCPACENTLVASAALVTGAVKAPVAAAPTRDEYELDLNDSSPAPTAESGPPKFCPHCGKPWKAGTRECRSCHYDLMIQRINPESNRPRGRILPKVDIQGVYLLLALAAAGVGIYYLIKNWNEVVVLVNSIWRR